MASPSLILTERQALVAMARILEGMDTEASDVTVDSAFTAVLAVIAGGLVVGGATSYRERTVAALSLAPTGELRVRDTDPAPTLTWTGPWGEGSPW